MDRPDYEFASRFVSGRMGLRLDGSVRARVRGAVDAAASDHRMDVADYIAALRRNRDLLLDLLDRITIKETSFFRDEPSFIALGEWLRTQSSSGVIWSAGCSNGQEPWSLAMLLDELGLSGWRVVATDVSPTALRRAAAGVYTGAELRGLANGRRELHLQKVDGAWQIENRLRRYVTFLRHDVFDEPPPFSVGGCQVMLCRYVLIYYTRETTLALLTRIADWLPNDGFIVLGGSESIWPLPPRLSLSRLGNVFVYRVTAPSPVPPPVLQAVPPRVPVALTATPRPRPSIAEAMREGETALLEGDFAGAVSAFRRAAFLDPDNPLAQLHLGIALERSGDRTSAASAFRRALSACDVSATEGQLGEFTLESLRTLIAGRIGGSG